MLEGERCMDAIVYLAADQGLCSMENDIFMVQLCAGEENVTLEKVRLIFGFLEVNAMKHVQVAEAGICICDSMQEQ